MRIVPGDFSHPQVIALLAAHLAGLHENSPPESIYALDLAGLQSPDISFFAAWQDGVLLGFGALKQIDAATGEIKSMRTHADHLRKGVAASVLAHLLAEARARNYRRVSLETGTGGAFEPALTLYRKYGFQNGDVFGDYTPSPHNQFLHLDLD